MSKSTNKEQAKIQQICDKNNETIKEIEQDCKLKTEESLAAKAGTIQILNFGLK